MIFFRSVMWRAFVKVIPLLVDIVFNVRGSAGIEKDQKDIGELKAKLKTFDGEIDSLYRGLRILIVGLLVVFLVSVSALVVGIIAVSK